MTGCESAEGVGCRIVVEAGIGKGAGESGLVDVEICA